MRVMTWLLMLDALFLWTRACFLSPAGLVDVPTGVLTMVGIAYGGKTIQAGLELRVPQSPPCPAEPGGPDEIEARR